MFLLVRWVQFLLICFCFVLLIVLLYLPLSIVLLYLAEPDVPDNALQLPLF